MKIENWKTAKHTSTTKQNVTLINGKSDFITERKEVPNKFSDYEINIGQKMKNGKTIPESTLRLKNLCLSSLVFLTLIDEKT